nr:uncharacterized protein LOC122270686 [Parasteatoda tepidariorum]
MKITDQLGNQQSLFTSNDVTPIGFKYRKYKINSDGLFCAEISTELQNKAHWLKPFPQELPSGEPRWGLIIKMNTPGRKMKSIWTIPTECAPRRPVNVGVTFQRIGNLVRMDSHEAINEDRIIIGNNEIFEDDDGMHIINHRRAIDQENILRRAHSLNDLRDI